MTSYDLASELKRKHVDYELIPHRRTEAAKDEATAIGVEPWQVAKTVVLTTDAGYVRTVLPAPERLRLAQGARAPWRWETDAAGD
jgi:prolyl-tRNA editing enzyme YbaK/EbsC (Cys-tRNA(Pro) deacylase)